MTSLIATYRVQADADTAPQLARFIAHEQTVELPPAHVARFPALRELPGTVLDIRPEVDRTGQRVRIAYPAHLAAAQLGQLLNLLYGNISMMPGIRLVDVELPDALLDQFAGPQFGLHGVRALTGVHGRPLLATAVKPRGLPIADLARCVYDFALGGGDIIKDDQNLVDEDFESFKARVDACADAVERANAQTGRRCLYLPHLAARAGELDRHAQFVRQRGLAGVLVCPLVTGIDTARSLCAEHGLLLMAHPALSGAYTNGSDEGIAHHVLLGTLFRLAGADISIFPAPGGRFANSQTQCRAITAALSRPMGNIAAALPAPAGGMGFEHLAGMGDEYGTDAVFLLGGSLLGHSDDLRASTEAFLERIREHFDERLEAPAIPPQSACEMPGLPSGTLRTLIRMQGEFQWQDRPGEQYKESTQLPFRGVRRVELIGRNGERGLFDLRYFELDALGHTSLEKHLHTHVIIAARGTGELLIDGQSKSMSPMDIAYVPPLAVHQLRNSNDAPFGFFCIVDRDRDRPMSP